MLPFGTRKSPMMSWLRINNPKYAHAILQPHWPEERNRHAPKMVEKAIVCRIHRRAVFLKSRLPLNSFVEGSEPIGFSLWLEASKVVATISLVPSDNVLGLHTHCSHRAFRARFYLPEPYGRGASTFQESAQRAIRTCCA